MSTNSSKYFKIPGNNSLNIKEIMENFKLLCKSNTFSITIK